MKPVGDGGSAAQGLPARGVKATLGEGGGAERVLARGRGQGEPKPGSRGAGVICRRPATAGLRRRGVGEWRPDNGVAYGLKGLAQKKARGSRVLTEGLRWTNCGAGEPTSSRESGGARRSWGRSCRGASPVPGLRGSTRGVPARESRQSGRPGMLRW